MELMEGMREPGASSYHLKRLPQNMLKLSSRVKLGKTGVRHCAEVKAAIDELIGMTPTVEPGRLAHECC